MFKFILNDDEAEIINELAGLFLDSNCENDLAIEEKTIKRLIYFMTLDTGINEFTIIDFYTMLVYLTWGMRNVYIRYAGQFKLTNAKKATIKNLQARIHYLLNHKLKNEFIYFDYDNNMETILENQNKVINEKLGKVYEELKLYHPILKKFKEEHCKVKFILNNEDKAILIPDYGRYYIYQEKMS